MASWQARLLGRIAGHVNERAVAALMVERQLGRLLVVETGGSWLANGRPIGTGWAWQTNSPLSILRRIEIINTTAGALTFSLAIMTVYGTPTPSTSNAFLAWGTSVAANSVWSWTGEVPLIDRYVYAKASGAGLVCWKVLEDIVS